MAENFNKNCMFLVSEVQCQRTNVLSSSYSNGRKSVIRIYRYKKVTSLGSKIDRFVARVGNSNKVHTLFSYTEKHTRLMFGKRPQLWEIEQ
jgi:hypothetical protein